MRRKVWKGRGRRRGDEQMEGKSEGGKKVSNVQ